MVGAILAEKESRFYPSYSSSAIDLQPPIFLKKNTIKHINLQCNSHWGIELSIPLIRRQTFGRPHLFCCLEALKGRTVMEWIDRGKTRTNCKFLYATAFESSLGSVSVLSSVLWLRLCSYISAYHLAEPVHFQYNSLGFVCLFVLFHNRKISFFDPRSFPGPLLCLITLAFVSFQYVI